MGQYYSPRDLKFLKKRQMPDLEENLSKKDSRNGNLISGAFNKIITCTQE
jgi:hypothetical protein